MSLQVGYYGLSLFAGAIVAGAVAVIAWSRAVTSVGRSLAVLMGTVFTWSLAAAFEAAAPDVATKVLLSKIEYFGIGATPVLMFLFALKFSRSGSKPRRGPAAALWLIPAATVVLAFTNEWHNLVWTAVSPAAGLRGHLLVYDHGTFFWIFVVYSYLLLFATTVLLLLSYFRFKGVHRKQALTLLLVFPLAWLGNALYLAGLAGGKSGHDYTPLGFALAGFFLLWAMFRLQLVDIVPVARERVVESMGESLVILDEEGRLAATNPAARRLLAETGGPAEDVPEARLLGRPAEEVFAAWPELAAGLGSPSPSEREIFLVREGRPRFFALRLTPLMGAGEHVTGRVAVLYDITRIKNAETSAVEARQIAETLREAGLTLSSNLDFKQVSDLILDLLKRVVPYDIGAFLTAEDGKMKLAAIKGPPGTRALVGESYDISGPSRCCDAVRMKRPLIGDVVRPEEILLPLHPDTPIRSHICVPVVFRDRTIGLIALYNSGERAFTEEDARVAELFASQVAIALDNSRRVEQMEKQAVTDQLTGLYNRRAFADMAGKEVGRARRYRRPLALILFDIDHFKNVNDSHGHLIGDHVLHVLTKLVTRTTRATDIVCRYGGEEFIVLMPEAGRDEAMAMAERLREEISRMTVVTAGGTLSLTISLGVAELVQGGDDDLDSLINRADRAMYQAKAAGRNAVRG
jgi:diguanylate cyclase (GGDEF)-like protein